MKLTRECDADFEEIIYNSIIEVINTFQLTIKIHLNINSLNNLNANKVLTKVTTQICIFPLIIQSDYICNLSSP